MCGCGAKTSLAKQSDTRLGLVNGKPVKYVRGHVGRTVRRVPIERRFWKYVNKTDICWLWTGNISPNGYGRTSIEGRTKYAHRVAYELLVGPVPEGLDLDHLCRNTRCVNPDHLEPVTHAENMRRGNGASGRNARKTHCKHGHPFDEDNTMFNCRGDRVCRVCNALRCKRGYEKRKAEGRG